MKSILIVAGENSGDSHGADVVREFKRGHADIAFFGVGGERLAEEGVEICSSIKELSAVGIFEITIRLPQIRRIFTRLEKEVQARNPAAAVLIDAPDFNLRLAKKLQKDGVPVLYYISPTIWAWRSGRLKIIRKVVTRMCLIFPFEKKLYDDNGIPAVFVGHPLKDKVKTSLTRDEFLSKYSLPREGHMITLLPGSRRTEIKNHLPVLIAAARRLRTEIPVHFLLVLAESIDREYLHRYLPHGEKGIDVLTMDRYDAIAQADLVLSSCGTANLETALLGTPFIAFYRLSPLTYYPFRRLVRIHSYSIVNILAARTVVPELIQGRFSSAQLVRETKALLFSEEKRAKMKDEFKQVAVLLGQEKASERVARELERIVFPPMPLKTPASCNSPATHYNS
jgi:lipid-A-disaccharide synthase